MSLYFDALETRTADQRANDLANALPQQIARAKVLSGYAARFADVDPTRITDAAALASLPVLRKSELNEAQGQKPPLGGVFGIRIFN